MTLNATIFPDLGSPTIGVDFNDLVLGPSGECPALAAAGMDFYAGLLEQRLRREPGWQAARRIIVAHSFGGMLALAWLTAGGRFGTGVDGLVLIATTAGPMFDRVRLRVGSFRGREVRLPVAALLPLWNRSGVTRSIKRLLTRGRLDGVVTDFRQLTGCSDLALDLAGWRATDWRAMRSYRLAMRGFDLRARLGEITTPTIVLHGDRDSLFAAREGRELAAGLRQAEFRLVPGAGHGLPLTHPQAVRNAVAALLGTPAGAG